jgi:hypothetical protein
MTETEQGERILQVQGADGTLSVPGDAAQLQGRLMALGQEKAEALRIAQEMHRELETFEDKQQALDALLEELDAAKAEAGYWSIFSITRLIERMRRLLRGGDEA